MTTRMRNAGEFCWFNLMTHRAEKERAFFGELLGWKFVEMPGAPGHAVVVGPSQVGAIFDLSLPGTPPETPAHIGVMVKVESADETARRAEALGGKVQHLMDVLDVGRMAVLTDPTGATIDVWEPRRHLGTDVDPTLPGAPCWFETLTTDAARASAFYSELFGWKGEVMGPMSYTVFSRGGVSVGGLMQLLPQMPEKRSRWHTNFAVTDVDATAKRAAELGGTVCVPPSEIPGVGRFSSLSSPEGVAFHVVKFLRRP